MYGPSHAHMARLATFANCRRRNAASCFIMTSTTLQRAREQRVEAEAEPEAESDFKDKGRLLKRQEEREGEREGNM